MSSSVMTFDRSLENDGNARHFVNISAIILDVGQYAKHIVPLSLWYLMTWCLRSMCLLLADAILFCPSLIVASLSSLNSIGVVTSIPISRSNITIQTTSLSASDNARYSASELNTVKGLQVVVLSDSIVSCR